MLLQLLVKYYFPWQNWSKRLSVVTHAPWRNKVQNTNFCIPFIYLGTWYLRVRNVCVIRVSSPHQNVTRNSHCSYLDIYISRKIRLCVVDLEGKFQTNLQAKLQLFILEIQIYYTQFSSIFWRICQIQCFLQPVTAILKSWNIWIVIWSKNVTHMYWPSENGSNSVQ